MIPRLSHVESWIFDLDNSLYPRFDQPVRPDRHPHGRCIIQRLLGCGRGRGAAGAEGLFPRPRHHARRADGASIGVDPHEFLDFVHDIDLARLTADPALVAALDRLPGRKFVFTNAERGLCPPRARPARPRQRVRRHARHPRHGLCAQARSLRLCRDLRAARHRSEPGLVRRRHGAQPRARPRRSA